MEICTLVCSGSCETRRRHSKRGAGARTGRNARPRHLCGLRTRSLVRPARERARFRGPAPAARARVLLRLPELRLGRRDAGDAVTRGGPAGAGPGRRRKSPARSPVACSRSPEVAVVNFTSQTFSIPVLESIGFPSVVTPPPEGCLAFRPRPEAARGFVGVQAGPREPEVTAGCARGREVLRGVWVRREDRPWGCSLVRTRLPLSADALRPPGGR